VSGLNNSATSVNSDMLVWNVKNVGNLQFLGSEISLRNFMVYEGDIFQIRMKYDRKTQTFR
jgi:hypothetical protein